MCVYVLLFSCPLVLLRAYQLYPFLECCHTQAAIGNMMFALHLNMNQVVNQAKSVYHNALLFCWEGNVG